MRAKISRRGNSGMGRERRRRTKRRIINRQRRKKTKPSSVDNSAFRVNMSDRILITTT